MSRLYKGRLLWNAFPRSLLFVACRAGMKRSRKAGMVFVVFREKPASEPSVRVFSEKDAHSEGLKGMFSKFDGHSEGLQGMFGKGTMLPTRCFSGTFFKNGIPMCLEMLFS